MPSLIYFKTGKLDWVLFLYACDSQWRVVELSQLIISGSSRLKYFLVRFHPSFVPLMQMNLWLYVFWQMLKDGSGFSPRPWLLARFLLIVQLPSLISYSLVSQDLIDLLHFAQMVWNGDPIFWERAKWYQWCYKKVMQLLIVLIMNELIEN